MLLKMTGIFQMSPGELGPCRDHDSRCSLQGRRRLPAIAEMLAEQEDHPEGATTAAAEIFTVPGTSQAGRPVARQAS